MRAEIISNVSQIARKNFAYADQPLLYADDDDIDNDDDDDERGSQSCFVSGPKK